MPFAQKKTLMWYQKQGKERDSNIGIVVAGRKMEGKLDASKKTNINVCARQPRAI